MSPAPSAGVCTVGVGTVQHNLHVRIAVVPDGDTAGLLAWLRDDGAAEGEPQHVPDVAAAIASTEQAGAVRWVWRSTRLLYPALRRRSEEHTSELQSRRDLVCRL